MSQFENYYFSSSFKVLLTLSYLFKSDYGFCIRNRPDLKRTQDYVESYKYELSKLQLVLIEIDFQRMFIKILHKGAKYHKIPVGETGVS